MKKCFRCGTENAEWSAVDEKKYLCNRCYPKVVDCDCNKKGGKE